MEDEEDRRPIVLEVGSEMTKAGFGGDKVSWPSVRGGKMTALDKNLLAFGEGKQ